MKDNKMGKGKLYLGLFLGEQTSIFMRLISSVQQINAAMQMISPPPPTLCFFPSQSEKHSTVCFTLGPA